MVCGDTIPCELNSTSSTKVNSARIFTLSVVCSYYSHIDRIFDSYLLAFEREFQHTKLCLT